MKTGFQEILSYMKERCEYDFTGCSHDMLRRRISMRFVSTGCSNFDEYYRYLRENEEEKEKFLQTVTIKVSHFFRNPLDFEIINKITGLLLSNVHDQNRGFRVWSAGCATGEEAYSVAISIRENLKNELLETDIIATDIDKEIIKKAELGRYLKESLKEVKFGLVEKYFEKTGEEYQLKPRIRKMVDFSVYNLLDKHRHFPPASVFGSFDLVLCRNVMIYYNREYQSEIFRKLYESMNIGSYLMLGEAENVFDRYTDKFVKVAPYSKIFRKTS